MATSEIPSTDDRFSKIQLPPIIGQCLKLASDIHARSEVAHNNTKKSVDLAVRAKAIIEMLNRVLSLLYEDSLQDSFIFDEARESFELLLKRLDEARIFLAKQEQKWRIVKSFQASKIRTSFTAHGASLDSVLGSIDLAVLTVLWKSAKISKVHVGGKTVRKEGVITTAIIDTVVAEALRRAQDTLGQQTALELIVATMRGNPSKPSFQVHGSDGLWTILAKAVEGVTAFEGLRMFIARIGGITTFLSAMRNPACDIQVQANLCGVIKLMAIHADSCSSIVNAQGIQTIVDVMKKSTGSGLRKRPKSNSNNKITSDNTTTVNSSEQENLTASAKVLREGSSALGNIAYTNSAFSHAVCLAGGIEAIIAGMKINPYERSLQEEACGALCNLSMEFQNVSVIHKYDGLDAIIQAMKNFAGDHGVMGARDGNILVSSVSTARNPNLRVQTLIFKALINILGHLKFKHNQVIKKLMKEKVTSSVVEIMKHYQGITAYEQCELQLHGCWLISELAAFHRCLRDELNALDTIKFLEEIMKSNRGHKDIQQKSILAISFLDINETEVASSAKTHAYYTLKRSAFAKQQELSQSEDL